MIWNLFVTHYFLATLEVIAEFAALAARVYSQYLPTL